jgi:hypothetical protein
MRWDCLFDDLEAQARAAELGERAAEVEERVRGEVGALRLVDRARASVDSPLRVRLCGGLSLAGRLLRSGPDWLLLDEGGGWEAVVATGQLVGVRGLGRYSAVPGSEGVVELRIGLRHLLRGMARDRSAVRIHLADGTTEDATIDRVGADFVDLAEHAPGEARRAATVRGARTVPTAALAVVRTG